MYPTWDKSEQGKKQRIGIKYGKRDSPRVSTAPPPSRRPPPLNLDGEATSTKCDDAVLAAETSPPYKSRLQPVRLNQSVQPSKKRNLASPSVDQRPPPPRKHTAIPLDKYEVPPPKRSKNGTHLPPERSKSQVSFEEHHPRVSSPSESLSPTADTAPDSPTSQRPNEDVGFRIVRHPDVVEVRPPPPMTRQDIERNAWAEAARLFRLATVIPSPPPHVNINGLYVLIAKTDDQWAPKKLLKDPDACMQYLHAQLEDGTIGQHIGNAFGQWYLYGNPTVCPSPPSSVFFICFYVLHIGLYA